MNYIITPTDRDILHKSHKYVDRKMGKNGKWIYYYNTAKSKIGISQYADYKKAKENFGNVQDKSRKALDKYRGLNRTASYDETNQRAAKERENNAEANYQEALKKFKKADVEFSKTPLSKALKLHSEAMNFINNLWFKLTSVKG